MTAILLPRKHLRQEACEKLKDKLVEAATTGKAIVDPASFGWKAPTCMQRIIDARNGYLRYRYDLPIAHSELAGLKVGEMSDGTVMIMRMGCNQTRQPNKPKEYQEPRQVVLGKMLVEMREQGKEATEEYKKLDEELFQLQCDFMKTGVMK